MLQRNLDSSSGQRTTIRLDGEWVLDETRRLGSQGAFGDLFEAQGPGGAPVVIKRIRSVTPELATGEVSIARRLMERTPVHIIPILDAGVDPGSGHHFIVMPRAERSLQERLDSGGPFQPDAAATVLSDVLTGLLEMESIAHGDLKPANVLLHDGRWKLADMGIARILDEAPASGSSRMFASAPYAAPEQWRFESATRATDVYAFGCLAHAVLTGEPPFSGRTQDEYCVQHLTATPEGPPAPAPLRALIQMCLAKERAARPSIETALVLLRRASGGST